MPGCDWIPGISQLKSGFQLITGDVEGAARTQENFIKECPVVSQVTSVVQVVTGDVDGAIETQKRCLGTVNNVANGIPVVGHVKGAIHLMAGDEEGGLQAMNAATRTTVVMGSGAAAALATGGIAAIPAGIAAGGAYDAAATIITDKPQGYVAAVQNIIDNPSAGAIFDAAVMPVGDGLAGYSGGQIAETVANTVKVNSLEAARSAKLNQLETGMDGGQMTSGQAVSLGKEINAMTSEINIIRDGKPQYTVNPETGKVVMEYPSNTNVHAEVGGYVDVNQQYEQEEKERPKQKEEREQEKPSQKAKTKIEQEVESVKKVKTVSEEEQKEAEKLFQKIVLQHGKYFPSQVEEEEDDDEEEKAKKIKIISYNINGLSKKKMMTGFLNYIRSHDIFILLETHIEEGKHLEFQMCFPEFSLVWEFAYRENQKGRAIAGMLIGIRTDLQLTKGVSCVPHRVSEVLHLEVKTAIQQFTLIPLYLRPKAWNTEFGNITDFFEEINSDKDIMLLGDLNVRIGELSINAGRQSEDKKVNRKGMDLFELCKKYKLVILNGHVCGDEKGRYTFEGTQGSSVVDIAAVSANILHNIKRFKVEKGVTWSDHFPIKITFKVSAGKDIDSDDISEEIESTIDEISDELSTFSLNIY